MNIAIIALTQGGAATAKKLLQSLPGAQLAGERINGKRVSTVRVFLPMGLNNSSLGGSLRGDGQADTDLVNSSKEVEYFPCTTPELLKRLFAQYQGVVCIMATGIVVRSLAPLLRTKSEDPGVVVVDERGRFAISLLSGHLGGANDLARAVAKNLGGTPVITTSTDVQGRLAVDVLARDLGVKLEPIEYLRDINARIAKGEETILYSDYPVKLPANHPFWSDACWQAQMLETSLGENLTDKGEDQIRVILTNRVTDRKALYLRPPNLVVGVGCRKGIPGEAILAAIKRGLELAGRSALSIRKLVSIQAKAGEAGIHWAAEQLQAETEFFSAETLEQIMQTTKGLAQSEFVNNQMGVMGVCEPASLAGCRQGKIVLSKQGMQGITVALAEDEFGW